MIYLDVTKITRPKFQIEITIPMEAPNAANSEVLLDLMLNVEALLKSWMWSYLADTPEKASMTVGVVYPGKKSPLPEAATRLSSEVPATFKENALGALFYIYTILSLVF